MAPTFAVEFWNGAWVAVSGLVDGTNGYETLGENVISFTAPVGWVTNTINTQGPFFYVRIRIVTIGTITQVPIARTATIDATRFLPYAEERIITPTGLADIAAWQEDTISKFIHFEIKFPSGMSNSKGFYFLNINFHCISFIYKYTIIHQINIVS